MRTHFYLCLIVASLPYLATAGCDVDACKIGTSVGVGASCAIIGASIGVASCGIGAWFTFGLSCLAGFAIDAAIAGGCAAADIGYNKSKEIIQIVQWLVSSIF